MKKAIIFLILVVVGFAGKANHIQGGQIFYEYVGNQTGNAHEYKVTLILMTNPNGVSPPATVNICASSSCFTNISKTAPAQMFFGSIMDSNCTSPLHNGLLCHSGVGFIQKSLTAYETNMTLPGTCSDFVFFFESCCYAGSITNVQSANTVDTYFEARLNNTLGPNTNVKFCTPFAKVYCVTPAGSRPSLDYFGGLETDGDSILYRLSTPKIFSGNCSNPNTSLANYASGHSAKDPFITRNGIQFDSAQGFLKFSISQSQLMLLQYEAVEFRYNSTLQSWVEIGSSAKTIVVPAVQNCASTGIQMNSLKLIDSASTDFKPVLCGDTTLSIAIKCGFVDSTLAPDGSDFRLFSPDTNTVPITGATAIGGGVVELRLFLPLSKNGNYTLIAGNGNDGNTVVNIVGNAIPDGDSLTFQVTDCSGVGLPENANPTFKIFPNPVQDVLHFEFEKPAKRRISVADVSGKTVFSQAISEKFGKLNIEKLKPGAYFLRAFSESGKPAEARFFKQ